MLCLGIALAHKVFGIKVEPRNRARTLRESGSLTTAVREICKPKVEWRVERFRSPATTKLLKPNTRQLADKVVGAIVIVPSWTLASRPRMIN